MTVLDAFAVATGLELDLVRAYAESLAAAEMWPNEDDQPEAKHMAALLVAVMATPEVVRAVGSLPFSEAVWSNALDSTQCRDHPCQAGGKHAGWFTFGHVLAGAIENYQAGNDRLHGRISAGKISIGFTAGEWFAELEVELRLETDLRASWIYRFRRSEFAPTAVGKLVGRAELPISILQDFATALDGQVTRSITSNDQPAVLLH